MNTAALAPDFVRTCMEVVAEREDLPLAAVHVWLAPGFEAPVGGFYGVVTP